MTPVSAVTATRYMSSVFTVSSLSLFCVSAGCASGAERTGCAAGALGADVASPQERSERERRSRQRSDREQRHHDQPQHQERKRVGERRFYPPCGPADRKREGGLNEPVCSIGRPAQEVAAARFEAPWHRTEAREQYAAGPALGIAGDWRDRH